MTLSPPIAIGATAEIHAWKDGQVLKLFKPGVSRSTVEYEANLTRIVHASGLQVPAVGQIIEFDGRFGLEYESVEGVTMLQALMTAPWKFSTFARQLAEIQAEMHTRHVPGLPSQRGRLERKIKRAGRLPDAVRQVALNALAGLPEDDKLCHGDFHPGNIVLTSRGPVIIDWIDASCGSPIMDVARSTLLMGGGSLPPATPVKWLVRLIRGWSYKRYLRRYFQLNPADPNELSHWVPVAAAARLDENIYADEDRLLALAQRLIQ
jgi:uncharacterized protein (TIGR02172 family)